MSMDVTRLPSGLVVVTDAMPHLESASLGVWVGSGSRDEQADEHGISHFLEHMAFKGTAKRTARQIAEEIEAVGGDLNAATSVETTAYYARVLRADVPLALDTLSDILANPTFEPEELAREKNVIVQEIGATEDTPGLYGPVSGVVPGTPSGWLFIGPVGTVLRQTASTSSPSLGKRCLCSSGIGLSPFLLRYSSSTFSSSRSSAERSGSRISPR